jgi:hypothetical protein
VTLSASFVLRIEATALFDQPISERRDFHRLPPLN